MNGIANEKRLLDKMQLPSRLETGANWEHIQADALRKQPVILSTPGHYFVIDGYDPSNGAYHIGQSGKVYRVLPDPKAAEVGCLRVVDESGEDYLYSAKRFILVDVPPKVRGRLLKAVKIAPA